MTAALFIGALIGPCASADAGPGEARLGLVAGLAIALTAARRLRHVCFALDDGDGDHDAS